MLQNIRKSAWLILATVAVLSLGAGAVVAHEGRPVGDYRFIVGWLEEPAYEGTHNSVSVRVNKIVDAETASAMGEQQEHHGNPAITVRKRSRRHPLPATSVNPARATVITGQKARTEARVRAITEQMARTATRARATTGQKARTATRAQVATATIQAALRATE